MSKTKYNKEKILELYSEGKTDKEIAIELNYSINSFATYRRNQLNLSPNKPREIIELTNYEKSILFGTLLGDSCVRYTHDKCKFPSLSFTHCIAQKEYFIWKCEKLKKLISSYNEYKYNNHSYSKDETFMHCIGKNMKCLCEIREKFYINNIKIIPIDFIKMYFDELSMYCLMMDDGSYDISSNSYILNTQCFSKENLEEFCIFLSEKLNLKFNIKKDNTLYLKHESNDIMIKILQKYNDCNSMNYKCCL